MSRSSNRRRKAPPQWGQDPYQKRAQRQGYRSRAGYKLLYIQEKYRIIRPGMIIVELGAAPGAWTQVAASLSTPGGLLIACDLQPMDPLPGVHHLQGDIRQESFTKQLHTTLQGRKADLLLSDMSPKLSGTPVVDQQNTLELTTHAINLATQLLRSGGALLLKTFQGSDLQPQQQLIQKSFQTLTRIKPPASRAASRELYLLARQRR